MNPFRPTRRNSLRFPNHDYSQNGAYFFTISVHEGLPLFGHVANGTCELNEFGKVVEEEWHLTGEKREDILLDAFCVMPNHFHGIVKWELDELYRGK